MHASIPTTYRGIRFRSRLEAKWAWVFDRLNWTWEYEPIDFNGWIPDFVIQGDKPILVDVKPIFSFDQQVAAKLENAVGINFEERYHLLILAAGVVAGGEVATDRFGIGWISDDFGPLWHSWDTAVVISPHEKPGVFGLAAMYASYGDRITGFHDGDHGYGPLYEGEIQELWAEATNANQWKAPR